MKRISRIILFGILAATVPLSLMSGQDKKNENKIKIVIDDGSGPETVLDTTITGDDMPEIITLKNGKVIHLDSNGDDGDKTVWVSVSDDDHDANKVYAYSSSKSKGERSGSHVYITSKDSKDGEKKIEKKIIISDGEEITKDDDGKMDMVIITDDDSDNQATEYVIAKNGMVVTIKGDDEAKVRELAKEIESKLDIKNDNGEGKAPVKAKTEKPGRK